MELGKQTYTRTCRCLLEGHPHMITIMKDHFDGQLETHPKPKTITVDEQLAWVAKFKYWLELGDKDGGIGDPSK